MEESYRALFYHMVKLMAKGKLGEEALKQKYILPWDLELLLWLEAPILDLKTEVWRSI